MGKVIYLNSWLDCPDLILRRNYSMQDKINEARIHFFYKCREDGKTLEETKYLYQVWVKKNKARIKLLKSSSECEVSSEQSQV